MRKLSRLALGLVVTATYVSMATAQGMSSGSAGVPKVLQITREFVKPGKAGMAHDKSESAFVDAMARAKWPTHYIGMSSLSGKTRSLYLTPYASFDAWQMDTDAVAKNATLASALDRAAMADGELLESMDQGVFFYSEEMSLHARADLSQARYMEINLFHVRPGKEQQWAEVVKMAKAGYEKGLPDSHWGMFQQVYGGDAGAYLLLISHKSLAEIDKGLLDSKKFGEAMGEEGMKKLDELFAECCEATQQQLFAINPHQSYVQDEWVKADPDFWKPKAGGSSMAKAPAEDKKVKP